MCCLLAANTWQDKRKEIQIVFYEAPYFHGLQLVNCLQFLNIIEPMDFVSYKRARHMHLFISLMGILRL